jgi:hypothetical protein
MTLWREPSEVEKSIDLKAIQDAFNTGEEELRLQLADLREKLIDDAIKMILQLNVADYHTLAVVIPDGDLTALRDTLESIYDHGRELVISELTAQGASDLGEPGIASTEDSGKLDDLSNLTASRLANDIQSRIIGAAASLAVFVKAVTPVNPLDAVVDAALESDYTDMETQLRQASDEMSDAYVGIAAREADHAAFGLGRVAEGEAQSDNVKEIYYSALLDDPATCQPCLETDGETGETEADVTECPNPECDGGAQCRCILIFVFDGESASAAP